jgi:DNA gyrase subunit A
MKQKKLPPRTPPAGSAALQEADYSKVFKSKYLTYALSVVKGRAIPDARDGLKPVQRRVLWAMHHDLKLGQGSRYRKSAAIVGMVLGKYHPHGELGAYGAMVRMAQDFSLRYPLIDGQGNFGSLDGDGAAAPRYTEARLALAAQWLLGSQPEDLQAVHWGPNYDNTAEQPVVLPASVPHLLLNGASGIAVGMATEIPPHRLPEVARAARAVLARLRKGQDPVSAWDEVLEALPAPDFPTGGTLILDAKAAKQMYRSGRGSVQVRARYHKEGPPSAPLIVFDEVPPSMDKATLVTKVVAAFDEDRGLAAWVDDWRDESAEDIRLVLQLKKGAPEEAVLGALWLRTPLQQTIPVNLTALLPRAEDPDGEAIPGLWDLLDLLVGWTSWRAKVVERRLTARKERLEAELNLNLAVQKARARRSEVTEVISNAEDRSSAKDALMSLLEVDAPAADHLLNLRMGSLARSEAETLVRKGEALQKDLKGVSKDLKDVWEVVDKELQAHCTPEAQASDPRRSRIVLLENDPWHQALQAGASVVVAAPAEDCCVLLSQQGWVRRQRGAPADASKVRTRDGDSLGWVLETTTRHMLMILTNLGRIHLLKTLDVTPATAGHGEPLSVQQGWKDGETPLTVLALSPEEVQAGLTVAACSTTGGLGRVLLSPELLGTPTKSGGKVLLKLTGDERLVFATPEGDPPSRFLLRTNGNKIYGAAPRLKFAAPTPPGGKPKQGPRLLQREHVVAWGRGEVLAEDGVTVLRQGDFPHMDWNGWAQLL